MPSSPQTATSPPDSDKMLTLQFRTITYAIISTTSTSSAKVNKKRNEEAVISSSSRNNEDCGNVEVRLCSDCEEKKLCDLMGIKFGKDKNGTAGLYHWLCFQWMGTTMVQVVSQCLCDQLLIIWRQSHPPNVSLS